MVTHRVPPNLKIVTLKVYYLNTEATSHHNPAPKGTLEYKIVKNNSNYFIHDDLMLCS